MINKIKSLIPNKLKSSIRKGLNFLIPGESMSRSKNKWNKLATENARYYVLTDMGEKITEEEFRRAGEKDFKELIAEDELLKKNLGNFKDKTALEIGCGIGRITDFIAQNFKKVFAIDISEEMVAMGKERLKNHKNIEFIANDGRKYPVKDSSVDLVFSYIVFQHMPNKKVVEENIKEIKRVLKDAGIAKIQLRGLPTSKLNWFYGPSFTKNETEKMLTHLGLNLIKTEGENQRYFWIWFSKI